MGLTSLILVIAFLPGAGLGREPESAKPKAKRAAKMVDAIINRNKAPKIVKWPDDRPSRAALFLKTTIGKKIFASTRPSVSYTVIEPRRFGRNW